MFFFVMPPPASVLFISFSNLKKIFVQNTYINYTIFILAICL